MSRINKQEILAEIQRCAAELGGRAPGRRVFESQTGIRESDWLGVYWVRWGDALSEAGLTPNELQTRFDDEHLLRHLADYVRQLGHFPSVPELRIKRRDTPDFPNDKVFGRFGPRKGVITALEQWCEKQQDYSDVHEICVSLLTETEAKAAKEPRESFVVAKGFVYMIRSGDRYKIGQTANLGRRTDEVIRQQAVNAHLVHSIPTDDPLGIERYWHERFADRRYKGEWFVLTREDVAAFKRRRTFM